MANSQSRKVHRIVEPQMTSDGAGVKLKRSIASRALDYVDPFLLLDEFKSDDPDDYIAGFPMHPHRGIETVTYMLAGVVEHQDSLGNAGTIASGDVQWMTAGRGIMHSEMPQQREGLLAGFQLWVNLPASLKMCLPRYQEVVSDRIPELEVDGVQVRVIAGAANGVQGPVTEIAIKPTYLDVALAPHSSFTQPVERGHTALAYVFDGEGAFGVSDEGAGATVKHTRLVIFDDGDHVEVRTGDHPVRFLFIAGKPLYEPVARYGPFVMNTREEIAQALKDLQEGTFV